MDESELNKIMLHTIPNGWANQSYLQGWDFDSNTYKENCDMFDLMEIDKQVCEEGSPSKTINWADYNCAGHSRKRAGRESTSSYNPKKGRAGKHKKKAGNLNDWMNGEKHALCMPRTLLGVV